MTLLILVLQQLSGDSTKVQSGTVTPLQQGGLRIVERSRLLQVFEEQKIRLTYSTDDDAQILKAGKILGSDSIVFVETEISSSQTSQAFVHQYGSESRLTSPLKTTAD